MDGLEPEVRWPMAFLLIGIMIAILAMVIVLT